MKFSYRRNQLFRTVPSAIGIVDDVDGSCENASVFQSHLQGRNGTHNNYATYCLIVCGKVNLRAVAFGCAPTAVGAVSCHLEKMCRCILVFNLDVEERQNTVGVGHIEHVSIFPKKRASGYGKRGGSSIRISAHGLIDHNVGDVLAGAAAASARLSAIRLSRRFLSAVWAAAFPDG